MSGKEIHTGTPRDFGPDPIKDFHFLSWHVLMKFQSVGNMEEECRMMCCVALVKISEDKVVLSRAECKMCTREEPIWYQTSKPSRYQDVLIRNAERGALLEGCSMLPPQTVL